MTLAEFVTLTKDLIVSGAAIIGAVVAIKGLNTWRRQLKGQSEYDLSRRILITLFKYRDAINGVRHPAMWAYEMPSPPEDQGKDMRQEQKRFYGTSKAYEARWEKVQKERVALYTDLLESEALWGDELKKLFKSLFDLEHELLTTVRHHIQVINPDTDSITRQAINDIDKKRRDILYDDFGNEDDDYKKDFKTGVETIERYLKPKLTHK